MARGKKKEENLTLEEKLKQALVPEEEWPYEVPGNWCWVRLKDVAFVITGGTPSKNKPEYYGGTFPFFKPADLDYGRNMVAASEFLSEEGKAVSRCIPAKSTAVCCIGSIGKCGYLCVDGTTNQQINSAIPKVNSLFLYYYCNTILFTKQLRLKASATTISIVNKSKMEQCLFPLPPLREQQRIANHIEEMFYKLDEIKEKTQLVLESSEDRKAAILYKAFSGALTAKWRKHKGVSFEGWITKPLSEVATLQTGLMKGKRNNQKTVLLPYLRVANVQDGYLDLKEIKNIEVDVLKIERYRLKKGDVLFTEGGDFDKLGRSSVWNEEIPDCIHQNHIFVVRTQTDTLDPYFLSLQAGSRYGKTYFIDCSKQTTNLASINSTQLKNFPVLIPTIEEQREIVNILNFFLGKEEQIKQNCLKLLEKIEEIKKSILSRAFRGELGTNNPDEESSIELLKTIL